MQDIIVYVYLVFLELILTFLVAVYLVCHYASKSVPLYVSIMACVSWFSSFSVICLLPYDIYLVFPSSFIFLKRLYCVNEEQQLVKNQPRLEQLGVQDAAPFHLERDQLVQLLCDLVCAAFGPGIREFWRILGKRENERRPETEFAFLRDLSGRWNRLHWLQNALR